MVLVVDVVGDAVALGCQRGCLDLRFWHDVCENLSGLGREGVKFGSASIVTRLEYAGKQIRRVGLEGHNLWII